jgi:FAD/FMN-containing dehydrogenase
MCPDAVALTSSDAGGYPGAWNVAGRPLLAVQGGISHVEPHMNDVLRINAEDLTVTVQPGVT